MCALILWYCHLRLGNAYSDEFIMAKKEGKELATVKVYLNTGIIAVLVGVGFVASTLIFGVLILVLK